MKLIIAIVQNKDCNRLIKELIREKFKITIVSSSGGGFYSGNTTLMICTADDLVEKLLYEISVICKTNKKKSSSYIGIGNSIQKINNKSSISVEIGSAEIFIVDVERYVEY